MLMKDAVGLAPTDFPQNVPQSVLPGESIIPTDGPFNTHNEQQWFSAGSQEL